MARRSLNSWIALEHRRSYFPAPHFLWLMVNYHFTNDNLTHFLQRIKMPREAEISLNEREFIKQALQEQIRIDRRAFDAFRPLELTFGEEYGVADVQLGKTRYVI
jgi:hypothetical protein